MTPEEERESPGLRLFVTVPSVREEQRRVTVITVEERTEWFHPVITAERSAPPHSDVA